MEFVSVPKSKDKSNKENHLVAQYRVITILIICISSIGSFSYVGLFHSGSMAQGNSKLLPKYVGGQTCAECHQEQYKDWKLSHHRWSLLEPNQHSVLAKFANENVTHNGVDWRFYQRDGKYFVTTLYPDNKRTEFEIKYTVGKEPLQQYLVELDRGRLQALDMAWNTEKEQWFHLYPKQELSPNNGLHWSGPYKNWNGRCAVCHSTNYKKNYSAKTDSFQSDWSEINVSCEACHGPGEAHLAWARSKYKDQSANFYKVSATGLVVHTGEESDSEIRLCAGCHSRRSAFDPFSPLPGSLFDDHYRLALLRPDLYFSDGQIKEEVYVYGSFLQSKMNAKGVRCSNCHDVHSGNLVADGNSVCTQCHSPAGNENFPTLTRKDYDGKEHHYHDPGVEGAKCVNCHMPARTFMQVDPRRDHSFRVPRPDLSEKIRSPNACTLCHEGQSNKWAADTLLKWYPDGRGGKPHFSQIFFDAQNNSSNNIAERLIGLALDSKMAPIVRATALQYLKPNLRPELVEKIVPLLRHKNSLIRRSTIALFSGSPARFRIKYTSPALNDPARSVRLEAAKQVINLSSSDLSKDHQKQVRDVMRDYQGTLAANADFPEIQLNLAGVALSLRNLKAAESALKAAVKMDPQLVQAWTLMSRIQVQQRQLSKAQTTLRKAIESAGPSAQLYQLLGQVFSRQTKTEEAAEAYKKAIRISEKDANLYLELAVLYLREKQYAQSIAVLNNLFRIRPDQIQGLELLALNQLGTGNFARARDTVRKIRRQNPNYRLNRQLLPLLRLP